MYAYFIGKIMDIDTDSIILEVNHIGYHIFVSPLTISQLPALGSEVKIYTYTCVREDAFLLYGFLAKDDLEIFKLLLTISGVGPKGGLAILSSLRPDDLRFAILSGDAKAISAAPGVGKKTAERIILELKGKISVEDALHNKEQLILPSNGTPMDGTMKNEAIEALIALGYGATEAMKAVNAVTITEDTDVEKLLKLALKNMF